MEIEQAENEYLNQSDGEDNDEKENNEVNSGGDRKRQPITKRTPKTPAKRVKTEFPCDFCEKIIGSKANLEVKLQLTPVLTKNPWF
jgi:hypothetical protein